VAQNDALLGGLLTVIHSELNERGMSSIQARPRDPQSLETRFGRCGAGSPLTAGALEPVTWPCPVHRRVCACLRIGAGLHLRGVAGWLQGA